MLPKDLTRDIKTRLKSIGGHINGILTMLDKDDDPEKILLQIKAVESAFHKTHNLLLDEVFRKSLAIKIADALKSCPGNCGQEEKLEFLRQEFPNLDEGILTAKMKEIASVASNIKKPEE